MRGLLAIAAGAFVALAPAWAAAGGPAVANAPGFGPVMSMRPAGPGVIQGGGWSLACLFSTATGATCSDSRAVTTTRSTAVPCLGSSGTWGTAAINTACIAPGGVPGVESYPPVTNYWVNSTTPESWLGAGASVSGNTLTDSSAAAQQGLQVVTSPVAGDWTTSCIVRAGTATAVRLRVDGNDGASPGSKACDFTGLTSTPTRISCSTNLTSVTTNVLGKIYIGGADATMQGTLIVDQCQLEKSSTPGRRCDSGGTATTCAADRSLVASTGFPTTSGKIDLTYVPIAATAAAERVLLDGRDASNTSALRIVVATSGALSVRAASTLNSSALTWAPKANGEPYRIRVEWSGAAVRAYRDGALVLSDAFSGAVPAWAANITIGGYHVNDSAQAQGTVSLVSVEAL